MPDTSECRTRAINAIRFLSADGVQKANSGHPGLPMGAAAIAYTIWTRHLRFSPPTRPGPQGSLHPVGWPRVDAPLQPAIPDGL